MTTAPSVATTERLLDIMTGFHVDGTPTLDVATDWQVLRSGEHFRIRLHAQSGHGHVPISTDISSTDYR
jgi:metal-dependent amidase/aminoacylase/carboxypeptidase family protein